MFLLFPARGLPALVYVGQYHPGHRPASCPSCFMLFYRIVIGWSLGGWYCFRAASEQQYETACEVVFSFFPFPLSCGGMGAKCSRLPPLGILDVACCILDRGLSFARPWYDTKQHPLCSSDIMIDIMNLGA